MFRELGLPLPSRITLSLYESPAAFERALVSSGGVSPALARQVRGFAVGVAFADRLLVLEHESHRGRRTWLRLLAHEMAHLSQIELAGGEGRGAQWLAEGMAEWVAFTVLDELRVAHMSAEHTNSVGWSGSTATPRAPTGRVGRGGRSNVARITG